MAADDSGGARRPESALPRSASDPESGPSRRSGSATPSSAAAWGLSALLLAAGVAHFVVPGQYQRIVPRILGDPVFWVRWSGGAEIGCAVLVAHPRTRRLGATLAAALFVVVFPANVQMALDGGIRGEPFPLGSPVVAWLRLPLQIPLIAWAWRVALSAKP